MGKQSYEELMDAGFEEVIEIIKDEPDKTLPPQVSKKAEPVKSEVAPYVVVDNTQMLAEINVANKEMASALGKMVQSMNTRPKAMDMKIKRNSSGFMDSVKVSFEY